MATQLDDLSNDEPEIVEPDDGGDAHEPDDGGEGDGEAQGDDDEDLVTFGSDAAITGEDEAEGVRNLREELKRERAARRALEAKVNPPVDDAGAKPDMDDYWDRPDEYDADLLAWKARKSAGNAEQQRRVEAGRVAQEKWERQNAAFEESWTGLRIIGKDAARAKVEQTFDATQQAMLVKAARGNAAGLFFLLGRDDASREKLTALADDPAEFIAEAAIMAKEVKVERRKPNTQPESEHRGSSGGGGGKGDAKLERLEAAARQPGGDRTALIAYKREKGLL